MLGFLQEILLVYQANFGLFLAAIAILGLIVGSFINVVIYRLPLMLENEWRNDCREFLNIANVANKSVNLILPRSACPECGHRLLLRENIPVLSYIGLRGKCSQCEKKISLKYPLVEVLTAIFSVLVAVRFGISYALIFALLLTWSLISLTFIDFDKQWLPDHITMPLLWLGLIVNINGMFATLESAVIGAVLGYLSLWSVYWVYKLLRNKEGMGYGDFKLLALLCAWFGWQYLALIILLSSVAGSVVGIIMILFRGHDKQVPIPFGPYLAGAGWIVLVYGEVINQYYYKLIGIG